MQGVLGGLFLYVLVQLGIGLWISRRIRSRTDYFLAGRSLGLGLGTFTIFATWFGAETCIGSAGAIYREGLAGGSADPFGYSLCLLLMGVFFAAPLWRRQLTTLADLFRLRYSPGIERLVVLIMVPPSVMWAAAQIRAFGQVLAASSDLEVTVAITIAAAVVITYTAFGGLLADAMTDFLQGGILIVGLSLLLPAVVHQMGGVKAALASVEPGRWNLLGGHSASSLQVIEAWAVPVFGSVVAQELVSRVIATRSPQIARRASLLAFGVYLLVGLIPAFIGLLGAKAIPHLEHAEQILPLMAYRYLPPFLYVLFAGALLSAILSTVDSALLAASSLTSQNLLLPLFPSLSERAQVRLARLGVVAFGALAYFLALHAEAIYALVEGASAFGSGGLFVLMVFGLFTHWGNAAAAWASLLAGVALWAWGTYLVPFDCPFAASILISAVVYLMAGWLEGLWEARKQPKQFARE